MTREPSLRVEQSSEPSLHPNKSSGDIVELKPCPFCGRPPVARRLSSGSYQIECDNDEDCSVCADVRGNDAEEAKLRWNTRTPDPESAAEIERLRREVEGLQRALILWMPSVDLRLDEPTRELSAQDAGLLVGYSGPTDGPCWGDAMLDRALTAESAVAAAWEEAAKIVEREGLIDSKPADEYERGFHDLAMIAASAIRAASGGTKDA